MRPLAASSAYMRPFTPLLSPPAVPMNTMPFQAIGADGVDSPNMGLATEVSHKRLPVLKS